MANGCKANLRYPRSSFAPGNITLCVRLHGCGLSGAMPMQRPTRSQGSANPQGVRGLRRSPCWQGKRQSQGPATKPPRGRRARAQSLPAWAALPSSVPSRGGTASGPAATRKHTDSAVRANARRCSRMGAARLDQPDIRDVQNWSMPVLPRTHQVSLIDVASSFRSTPTSFRRKLTVQTEFG